MEHIIGENKQYALMRKRYHGTLEQFNDELNVVTGLVNLKRVWDGIKSREDPSLMVQLGAWRTLTWGGPEPPEPAHEMRSATPVRGGCARRLVDPAILVPVRPLPPQKLPF